MVKENIKLPDAGLSPVGHVTIDLMDESGNVIERQEKGNYVHTRMLELIGQSYMRRAFSPSLGGSSNDVPRRQIQYMVLTNNGASPNQKTERYVEGDLIGAGSLNNIYDSEYLGNFNSSESIIGSRYTKLVYDFGTSTGNGTFQSIYTGDFDPVYHANTRQLRPFLPTLARSNGGRQDVDTGAYRVEFWYRLGDDYVFVNGTTFSRTKSLNLVDFNTMEELYNAQNWETFTLPYSVYSATLDTKRGVYYFGATGSTSSWALYSAPYDDPTNMTLVKNRASLGTKQYYFYGAVYDPTTDTMLESGSSPLTNSSSDQAIYRHSLPEYELLETVVEGLYSRPSLSLDGKILYAYNSFGMLGVDLGSRRIIRSAKGASVSRYTYRNIVRELTPDIAFEGRYYGDSSGVANNYTDLVANFGFFSRAVLDSPVTKTAQNTMKITYEFTMDDWII